MQDAKWVQVRSLREGRRLLFRFNPVLKLIEVKTNGVIEVIRLEDYMLPHERPSPGSGDGDTIGVNFALIDGQE